MADDDIITPENPTILEPDPDVSTEPTLPMPDPTSSGEDIYEPTEPTLPFPTPNPADEEDEIYEENVELNPTEDTIDSLNDLIIPPVIIPHGYVIGLHRSNFNESYAKAYSILAISLGHIVICFSSNDVNYDTKTINALVYDPQKDTFTIQESNYPDIIDNDVGYLNSELYNEFTLSNSIPFIYYPLGNKYKIYKRLSQILHIKNYLLPFKRTKNPLEFLDFLKYYKTIILKPIKNSNNNIIKLNYLNNGLISVNDSNAIYIGNDNDLVNHILVNILNNDLYDYILMQNVDFIINNKSFDITFHVSRSFKKSWRIAASFARYWLFKFNDVNKTDRFVIDNAMNFLMNYFNDNSIGRLIFEQMKSLSYLIAERLQDFYPDHLINAISINFGITSDQRIYILEVNSNPTTTWYQLDHALMHLQYALYMVNPGL